MEDPLQIGHGAAVPLSEIELRASRSSGPGGQHANVTASRVEAVFDVEASSSLSEEQKRRVMARCGPVVRATAQDTRSQARNRELALERLRARLSSALTRLGPAYVKLGQFIATADAANLSLLQRAEQLGLKLERQVADLV